MAKKPYRYMKNFYSKLLFLFVLFLLIFTTKVVAQEIAHPQLSVPIGKFGQDCAQCNASPNQEDCLKKCSPFKDEKPENWLGLYILAWFNYIIGAIGIIAVMAISWGGIKWTTSGGNTVQIGNAKNTISNAIKGIVLLLCSYTILKTINPNILNLTLPKLEALDEPKKICCQSKLSPNYTSEKIGKCGENENVCDMRLCKNISFINAQKIKTKKCELGFDGIITMANNDYGKFIEQAMKKCEGSYYTNKPKEILNLDRTSKELTQENGEFFGCYFCK